MAKKPTSTPKATAAAPVPPPAPPAPAAPAPKRPVAKAAPAQKVAPAIPAPAPAAAPSKATKPKAAAKPKAVPKPKAGLKAAAPAIAPRKLKPKPITHEDIALRAYFIAEKRHALGQHAEPHQDWLEAERQLKAEQKAGPAKK